MQIVAIKRLRRTSPEPLGKSQLLQRSVGLPAQESGYIEMVVTLWRRRNRSLPPVGVEALRCRPLGIFRYRLVRRHLLGDAALGFALGQRRKRRERRT